MKVLIFDVETTGLNPKNDEIIEFGLILANYENGKLKKVKEDGFLIKQDFPIPKKITEITKITDDMLNKKGISKVDAYKRLKPFLEDISLVVGYNLNFDIHFLLYFIKKFDPNFVYKNNKYLCLMTVYKDFNRFPHRLENAIEKLGVDAINSHRAIDDAIATFHVFNKISDLMPKYTNDCNANILDYTNYFGFNPNYPEPKYKQKEIFYIAQRGNWRDVWKVIKKTK